MPIQTQSHKRKKLLLWREEEALLWQSSFQFLRLVFWVLNPLASAGGFLVACVGRSEQSPLSRPFMDMNRLIPRKGAYVAQGRFSEVGSFVKVSR